MINDFLIYLLKASLSIAIMMSLFRLALASDLSFARNRFYLIGAMLWSITIPLLNLNNNVDAIITIPSTYTIMLNEVTVTAGAAQPSASFWNNPASILIVVYLTGMAIFASRMLTSYLRLLYIISTSRSCQIGGHRIRVTSTITAPFAFFGWIVFPEKLIGHNDLEKMLLHEQVHSRQLHSLDLLLCELFMVFQWFNPAAWMLKKLIVENHEFTADREVISYGISTYEYQATLVNTAIGREVVPVNHFSVLLIKKRIKMMNKNENRIWYRAKSALSPLAFVLALALTSFTVEKSTSTITSNEDKPTSTTAVGEISKITPLADTAKTVKQDAEDEGPVFSEVEQMPTFSSKQYSSLHEYIGKNINYPAEAAKKGVSGNVFVEFIISEKGKVTNPKVLRGADSLLNAEAIRVVKSMPDWIPGVQKGKKVKVKFVIPISFNLDGLTQKEQQNGMVIVYGYREAI